MKYDSSGKLSGKFILSAVVCMCVSSSIFAYDETGIYGNTGSWETSEYNKDWALKSMNASTAYALGFNGSNVKIGVMDSGILVTHPEFQDGRFNVVKSIGEYSKNGMRYPDTIYGNSPLKNILEPKINEDGTLAKDSNGNQIYILDYDETNKGEFKKGDKFDIDGAWRQFINDSHGTHVAGSMAASRNGSEMHGVAFGSNLYAANTGGTDGMTYGPNQDYNYFLQGYTNLANSGVKVINNSWGSNRKVNSAFEGAIGYKTTSGNLSVPEYNIVMRDVTKITETNNPKDHMYLKNLDEAKKAYYQFVTSGEKSFIDAAYEVAVNHQIIQVFTAGNRSYMAESFTRAMLPYFRPDAEKYWINVTGQTGGDGYPYNVKGSLVNTSDVQIFNEAGHSKWWTIASPARNIYSSIVDLASGEAGYAYYNGTSMAAPHVSGALGVIFGRYPYMSTSQGRDVMLTTARQTSSRPDSSFGQPLARWGSQGLGVPSEVWGWGILDLGAAMFGPGQFLGKFDVTMNQDDIWQNDISDKAIKFRQQEDTNEAAIWQVRKAELDAKASLSAQEKAEITFQTARQKARDLRAQDGYAGSLVKRGSGTLTLTGNNSFSGDTIIYGGQISALNQSLTNTNVSVENQGRLEILREIDVLAPVKDPSTNLINALAYKRLTSEPKTVTARIKNGGEFIVNDGVSNINLTFDQGSLLGVSKRNLVDFQNLGINQSKIYSASGNFVTPENASVINDLAFFDVSKILADNQNIQLGIKRQAMSNIARTNNENIIANLIDDSKNSQLHNSMLMLKRNDANRYFEELSQDKAFKAKNNSVINSFLLKNNVMNRPDAIIAEVDTGVNLWLSSYLNRINDKTSSSSKLSSNGYSQLVGLDFLIGDNSKVGAFVGLGKTNHKSNGIKEAKSDDYHVGVYGESNFDLFKVNAGAFYTKSDREQNVFSKSLQNNYTNADEAITNVFIEAGYTGIKYDNFVIEPYVGGGYIHASADSAKSDLISIDNENRDLTYATIGVKPSMMFKLDGIDTKAKLDLAYNKFFGDKEPNADIDIFGVGRAKLTGNEIKDLTTVNAGFDFYITKNTSLSLSYMGAYSGDITSNGVNAKINIAF